MTEFLAMGGYAHFVWSSYGVAVVLLGGLALATWARGRALKSRLERRFYDPS